MVFPQQGWVMVDDISCRVISVYRQDAQTASNVLVGTFYLSSDLSQIFKQTARSRRSRSLRVISAGRPALS